MEKKYNTVKFTLPKGTAEILTTFVQTNSHYKNVARDYFKYVYIVHAITAHYIDNYVKPAATGKKIDYKGCSLHQRTLASIMGTMNPEASKKLKELQEISIIKKIGGYEPKSYAQHYSLVSEPDEFKVILAKPEYTSIPYKIISKRKEKLTTNSPSLELYESFIRNITLSLPIKYQLLLDNSGLPVEELDYVTVRDYDAQIHSLTAIQEGNWFVHRPDAESRIYTNLTNLKREFRDFLRYDNEPFIELDIRNSQPLIATILIKEYWLKHYKRIPEDVWQYQQDCEQGVFYDYFMKENNVDDIDRGEFKKRFFSEVFFSRVTQRMSRLKKQFIGKYPSAMSAIDFIKGGIGSETYNQFAIQLQRKEANLIFDKINLELIESGIPSFNIFDSILCLDHHKNEIEKKLIHVFNASGLNPMINFKRYGTIN